jgi:ribosome-associated heat shock protein Hsp15
MPEAPPETVRLDVWLDVACLFRTRSEAQRACKGGKVEVAGVRAKPHHEIRAGDRLTITRPLGRRQLVVVRGIETRHITKAEARLLYEDLTPPLSAAELEMRRLGLDRSPGRAGAPDKRERRELRRLKGREPR